MFGDRSTQFICLIQNQIDALSPLGATEALPAAATLTHLSLPRCHQRWPPEQTEEATNEDCGGATTPFMWRGGRAMDLAWGGGVRVSPIDGGRRIRSRTSDRNDHGLRWRARW
jgi:hypothetical protein